MVTKTKNKLLEIIKINGAIAPVSLAEILNISPQAIHRHLKSLLEDGVIKRIGTPPSVFYNLSNTEQDISALVEITPKERAYIEENFSRLLPNGELLKGTLAFLSWLKLTKQTKSYKILCERYIELHKEIHSKKENGLFNLTQKIFDTFGSSNLKSIYCSDFYSLPQFGKTYLGNLITAGKSGQNKNTINEIAKIVTADIANLISSKNIDHIAWIPHSIPRKVMFLKVLRKILKLNLPTVELVKVFQGNIPIAQKSLSRLEDRIENARETIVIKTTKINTQSVLIIDDALGSGATMNEVAKKIQNKFSPKTIYGYAVVGSYKGFDVISVV